MHFKKLEICGFKSFADKTTLQFEPGITAIVGPNGCGKSNIFDAIRWCLGEQSIKSLRGAKMEDVIFNGTETMPPQNYAEVSLSISNEAKILPIDYQEVTITRRLYRSGESEYLLNNSPVRLRDINEMLMGTGIGAESYSLIEQGKIDLVISSRPEDRRLVFDEATGVSKYKAKKKEAVKKMEETAQNLLRLNDIMLEVRRQIGSIERQASKARRYKEVFDKLKEADLKITVSDIRSIHAEYDAMVANHAQSHQQQDQLVKQMEEVDRKLIHQKACMADLDSRLAEIKQFMQQLESETERHEQHVRLDLDRINDISGQLQRLQSQRDTLAQKTEAHERTILELTTQIAGLSETFEQTQQCLQSKQDAFNALLVSMAAAQQEIADAKSRLVDLHAQQAQYHNQIHDIKSSKNAWLARQKRLETEKTRTQEENADLLKNIEGITNEITHQKNSLSSVETRVDALRKEQKNLETALRFMEEQLRCAEHEKLSLQSQMDFLKDLKLKYDSMPEAKNGILLVKDTPPETIGGILANAGHVSRDESDGSYRIECELKFISFDLPDLERRLQELSDRIRNFTGQMDQEEDNLLRIVADCQKADDEHQQQMIFLTNKEAVYSNLSDHAKKVQAELTVLETELEEVTKNLSICEETESQLTHDLNQVMAALDEQNTKLESCSHTALEQTQTKEKALVEIAQLKAELDNHKLKIDGLTSNLTMYRETQQQDSQSLKMAVEEIEQCQLKIGNLDEEITRLQTDMQDNQENLAVQNKEFQKLSQMRMEEMNTADFLQTSVMEMEETLDRCKEETHRQQLLEQELTYKGQNIRSRILQSYNIDIDQLAATAETVPVSELDQLKNEIEALREKVNSMGTVNLVAIEELEELKNRDDFLTKQQADLLQAKDSLHQAILTINRNTRKMFLETFEKVAEEFKNYYKLLFNGGEAKLYLLDNEDVLESGIEIVCRPPGKKLQNISLLSGGEKALSAIALIFAIFKTKPSPFCVLDEIDAALDESNIDRFSRILSEFAVMSQFITITHNKKTMSRAHVMYGITMERSGVSKVVSVKLQETEIDSDSELPPSITNRTKKSAASV